MIRHIDENLFKGLEPVYWLPKVYIAEAVLLRICVDLQFKSSNFLNWISGDKHNTLLSYTSMFVFDCDIDGTLDSRLLPDTEAFCVIFQAFLYSADFLPFSKSIRSKNSFRRAIRVSNSLDPDQARQNVGPDLGPNCLQRLSADDISRQRF